MAKKTLNLKHIDEQTQFLYAARRRKYNPYLIEYIMAPNEKVNLADLYEYSDPVHGFMEECIVYGMMKATRMLEASGFEGAVEKFEELIDNGHIVGEAVPLICPQEVEDESTEEAIQIVVHNELTRVEDVEEDESDDSDFL